VIAEAGSGATAATVSAAIPMRRYFIGKLLEGGR